LIPWQTRKALAWDATVTSTLAGSYIHQSATTAGAAAELAAARKVSKYEYSCLFMFQPVVLETLSPINKSAIRFMEDLGGRISAVSSEAREGVFLFQRLSVLMQRFNAILVRDSFCTSEGSLVNIIYLNHFIFFLVIFLLNLLNCSILSG